MGPIWFHCRQAANTEASHCGKGMAFAMNPGANGSNDSYAAFKAKALDMGKQLAASNGGTTPDDTTTNITAPNGILRTISNTNNTALNGDSITGNGTSLTGNGTTTMFSGTVVFSNPIDDKTTVNGTFPDCTTTQSWTPSIKRFQYKLAAALHHHTAFKSFAGDTRIMHYIQSSVHLYSQTGLTKTCTIILDH